MTWMWDPAFSDWIYSSHTFQRLKQIKLRFYRQWLVNPLNGCGTAATPMPGGRSQDRDIKGLQSGHMDNSYYSANVHFVLEIEGCQSNVCCYYYTEKKIWPLPDFRVWEDRKSHKYLQVFPNSYSSVPKDSRLTKQWFSTLKPLKFYL